MTTLRIRQALALTLGGVCVATTMTACGEDGPTLAPPPHDDSWNQLLLPAQRPAELTTARVTDLGNSARYGQSVTFYFPGAVVFVCMAPRRQSKVAPACPATGMSVFRRERQAGLGTTIYASPGNGPDVVAAITALKTVPVTTTPSWVAEEEHLAD